MCSSERFGRGLVVPELRAPERLDPAMAMTWCGTSGDRRDAQADSPHREFAIIVSTVAG